MAGDWIKMRCNLWDDPRVSRLVDLTDSSEAAAIGALYWLWATADQHTEDGHMPGLTLRQIDRKTGIPGIAAAIVAVGWLKETESGVTLLNFDEHNGASAKKRCQTAKRVATHRTTNADVTQPALPKEEEAVTEALAREEKRESNTPISPQGGKRPAAVSLKTWLETVKAAGEKAIPEDDAVFAYATDVGIPDEFMRLAWLEFRARYSQPDAKRYRDFRSVFRKAVRGNWFKLWWLDPGSNQYALTTVGMQAQRAHEERRAA